VTHIERNELEKGGLNSEPVLLLKGLFIKV